MICPIAILLTTFSLFSLLTTGYTYNHNNNGMCDSQMQE